jgi:hypothetical protein
MRCAGLDLVHTRVRGDGVQCLVGLTGVRWRLGWSVAGNRPVLYRTGDREWFWRASCRCRFRRAWGYSRLRVAGLQARRPGCCCVTLRGVRLHVPASRT